MHLLGDNGVIGDEVTDISAGFALDEDAPRKQLGHFSPAQYGVV